VKGLSGAGSAEGGPKWKLMVIDQRNFILKRGKKGNSGTVVQSLVTTVPVTTGRSDVFSFRIIEEGTGALPNCISPKAGVLSSIEVKNLERKL